jgi:integrase
MRMWKRAAIRCETVMTRDPIASNDPIPNAVAGPRMSTGLVSLVETAQAYARAATSQNTLRAYAADWRDYLGWRARQGLDARPLADPETIGLYLAAMASGAGARSRRVATIERRLSALCWQFTQLVLPFDRGDRHVATVLAGVRRTHARPPVQKEALLPEHLIAMLDALPPSDLRNLRDRAILLIGFAGGLRRSEIVGLDCDSENSLTGAGWPEFLEGGLLLTLRGKTGWREVEIGRGSSEATCPVVALETWMKFARVVRGPLFRRVTGDKVGSERLNDRHVARLVKRMVLVTGLRGDLSETERVALFSGHSLRAGLASSAEIDERYVQKQLGHASAEMTRRYQRRRDRFRVNLTKAAGL